MQAGIPLTIQYLRSQNRHPTSTRWLLGASEKQNHCGRAIEALVDGTAPQKIAKRLSPSTIIMVLFRRVNGLKRLHICTAWKGLMVSFVVDPAAENDNVKIGVDTNNPVGLVFMPKIAISGLILLGGPGCGAPQRARASEGGAAQKRRRSAPGEATQDDMIRQETYELVKQQILRETGDEEDAHRQAMQIAYESGAAFADA